MRQALFWVPFKTSFFPEGLPVYAYGAMLFTAFVVCVWFTSRRARRLGYEQVSRETIQDMAITLFVVGLAGARITYMWQFGVPWYKFFRIWEGGIVLYGGIIGGAIAFIAFYYLVLRKFHVTLWQMADLAAPSVAIGIAIGRVGCLMNGCCWGTVAPTDCPAVDFPLLTAPAREMLVERDGQQTATGFLTRHDLMQPDDPRTVVGPIEAGAAAAAAGIKQGDKIVKIRLTEEWLPNGEVLLFSGPTEGMARAKEQLKPYGLVTELDSSAAGESTLKIVVDDPQKYAAAFEAARSQAASIGRQVIRTDLLTDLLNSWPRGRNSVQFVIERDGKEIELPAFTPRTIGLHPTQIYETISMGLIVFLLLSFYPFRRHDGQVWVLFMVTYAIHRFLNEILRTEPIEGFDMTLSQNISVLVLVSAIMLEIYLRLTQPRRIREVTVPLPLQPGADTGKAAVPARDAQPHAYNAVDG